MKMNKTKKAKFRVNHNRELNFKNNLMSLQVMIKSIVLECLVRLSGNHNEELKLYTLGSRKETKNLHRCLRIKLNRGFVSSSAEK